MDDINQSPQKEAISNKMEYNGYIASIDFSSEDEVFYGKVLNTTDLIMFEGKSVKDLRKNLEKTVEDYLQTCKSVSKAPVIEGYKLSKEVDGIFTYEKPQPSPPEQLDEQAFRNKIADILSENIMFSGQVGGYVIHGALDKIWQLFQSHQEEMNRLRQENEELRSHNLTLAEGGQKSLQRNKELEDGLDNIRARRRRIGELWVTVADDMRSIAISLLSPKEQEPKKEES